MAVTPMSGNFQAIPRPCRMCSGPGGVFITLEVKQTGTDTSRAIGLELNVLIAVHAVMTKGY